MKVVLFKIRWFNPKQLAIGLFTWSKVCHAGLLFNGERKLYDASESRGNVDYNKNIRDFGGQEIIVYDIPEDETLAKKYALAKRYTKYDWKGIAGWVPLFDSNDPQTVYCFELVLQTLLDFTTVNGFATRDIAPDLGAKLFQSRIDSDDIFILMERARLVPIYQGKAKNFIEA